MKDICVIKAGGSILEKHYEKVKDIVQNKIDEGFKVVLVCGYSVKLNGLLGLFGCKKEYNLSSSGISSRVLDNKSYHLSLLASFMKGIDIVRIFKKNNMNVKYIDSVAGEYVCGKEHIVRYNEGKLVHKVKSEYFGRITEVNSEGIIKCFDINDVLVMTPKLGGEYKTLLCDADYFALEIAQAISASSIDFITENVCILNDGKNINFIDNHNINYCIKNASRKGMKKKLSIIKKYKKSNNLVIQLIALKENHSSSNNLVKVET